MRILGGPGFADLRRGLPRAVASLRGDDARRPVLVVVPGDLARDAARDALARAAPPDGPGFLGVRVVTIAARVRELAAPARVRAPGRPLAPPGPVLLAGLVLTARARRGGRATATGPLRDAADSPGLARAVAATIDELARGGFDPDGLATIWDPPPDPLRADLLAVWSELERALARRGLRTLRREEREAAAAAGEAGPADHPVVLWGFHDLTVLQRRLVEAIAARSETVLLVPGPDGAGEAACAPLLAWAQDRGAEVGTIPPTEVGDGPPLSLAPGGVPTGPDAAGGMFAPLAFVDPGPERVELSTHPTEAAEVRAIARRIRDDVAGGGRAFDDFAVVLGGSGPSPLLVRRVLERAGLPVDDRIGLPVARTGGGRRALALARAASARDDDREREALAFLVPVDGLPAADDGDDPVLGDPFARFGRARDWTEAIDAFRRLHRHVFGAPVAPRVADALDALSAVHGDAPNRPRDFAPVLAAALADLEDPDDPGRGAGDAAVLLVRRDAARGLRRPVVFHPGLVEGSVRSVPPADPLLPDDMRRELADAAAHTGCVLAAREDAREERLLLARFAFETAGELAILSWAERARTGGETRNPSGLLLDLVARRAGGPAPPGSDPFRRACPVPPADDARLRPVDPTDLDLALLAGDLPPDAALARWSAEPRTRHVRSALRAAEARWRTGVLGPVDGVLSDPRAIEAAWGRVDPARRPWSPTAVEALLNCPFAFLVDRVLGLEPPVETGEDWDPRERGEIFHGILEALHRGLAADGLQPIVPERLPEALARLDVMIDRLRDGLAGTRGSFRAPREASLAALRHDVAIGLAREAWVPPGERGVPWRFELAFGDEGTPPAVDLGDGRTLPLRGRIDRVDRRPDDTLDVVDLKTGAVRTKPGRLTTRTGPKVSVHLQLPLYLEAVAQVTDLAPGRARYAHATADAGFRDVVFDADDLERTRPALRGLLRHALSLARAGWYPCTPGTACCRPELSAACGPAVAARFARKAGDPGLEAHLARLRAADDDHAADAADAGDATGEGDG